MRKFTCSLCARLLFPSSFFIEDAEKSHFHFSSSHRSQRQSKANASECKIYIFLLFLSKNEIHSFVVRMKEIEANQMFIILYLYIYSKCSFVKPSLMPRVERHGLISQTARPYLSVTKRTHVFSVNVESIEFERTLQPVFTLIYWSFNYACLRVLGHRIYLVRERER